MKAHVFRMSEKNTLQERCQKNRIPLPVYHAWSRGPPHKLAWFAQVSLNLDKDEIKIETTIPAHSKTEAEKKVAALMLDYLGSHEKITPEVLPTSPTFNKESKQELVHRDTIFQHIYLIDLENKPCFKEGSRLKFDALYIGFLNSIHHSVDKYATWHHCQSDNLAKEISESRNNRLYYLAEGGSSDLADHLMTAMLYPVVQYIKETTNYPAIHIISGDHAGWCTRACLEQIVKWQNLQNLEMINTTKI